MQTLQKVRYLFQKMAQYEKDILAEQNQKSHYTTASISAQNNNSTS
jgi:hypothetical protein